MAFDHDDTDFIYEKQILPVLKSNGIIPVIINRQQSNDDINIQIVEQLQRADLCITDLTYTRPSVYYEAGYAQRTIPVIYTVRKDHLNSGQPDNLRVHFDLQMKPLIAWKSQDDPTFASRLEKRIKKTFLITWVRLYQTKAKNDEEIERFNSLPLTERLKNSRKEVIRSIQKLGFPASTWSTIQAFYDRKDNLGLQTVENANFISAHKISNSIAQYVSIQSFQKFTKNDLVKFNREINPKWRINSRLIDKASEPDKKRLKTIYQNHIFLFLKPVSKESITNVLDDFTPHESPLHFKREYVDSRGSQKEKVRVKVAYYFLSGIKSISDLKEELKMLEKQFANYL